jgi:cbb3-type cytochrome oxidase subunit 1
LKKVLKDCLQGSDTTSVGVPAVTVAPPAPYDPALAKYCELTYDKPGEELIRKDKEMWSVRLINVHFWVATIGIVLYIAAMWIAGVMQGLMWRAVSADGTLTYSFVESVKATYPFYMIRLLGGVLYLGGMLIMAYNVARTIAGSRSFEAQIPAPAHA